MVYCSLGLHKDGFKDVFEWATEEMNSKSETIWYPSASNKILYAWSDQIGQWDKDILVV